MRSAQIDATLCLLTTLSLYSLLRHLFWGPAWGWYFLGGFAAGLGVITKGVGFLPILVLLLYCPCVATDGRAWRRSRKVGWRWAIAPVAMLLGICIWFVPMLVSVASKGAVEYDAYRDEILFQQTVTRYASAWHHHEPWYFFLVERDPGAVAAMEPAAVLAGAPLARCLARARCARVVAAGLGLVLLLFFSLTPGKRGIYMHPALAGVAMAPLRSSQPVPAPWRAARQPRAGAVS